MKTANLKWLATLLFVTGLGLTGCSSGTPLGLPSMLGQRDQVDSGLFEHESPEKMLATYTNKDEGELRTASKPQMPASWLSNRARSSRDCSANS